MGSRPTGPSSPPTLLKCLFQLYASSQKTGPRTHIFIELYYAYNWFKSKETPVNVFLFPCLVLWLFLHVPYVKYSNIDLFVLVVDEQNAHTEEQENQAAEEYRKELEESKEEEKDEDTKELDSLSGINTHLLSQIHLLEEWIMTIHKGSVFLGGM